MFSTTRMQASRRKFTHQASALAMAALVTVGMLNSVDALAVAPAPHSLLAGGAGPVAQAVEATAAVKA